MAPTFLIITSQRQWRKKEMTGEIRSHETFHENIHESVHSAHSQNTNKSQIDTSDFRCSLFRMLYCGNGDLSRSWRNSFSSSLSLSRSLSLSLSHTHTLFLCQMRDKPTLALSEVIIRKVGAIFRCSCEGEERMISKCQK